MVHGYYSVDDFPAERPRQSSVARDFNFSSVEMTSSRGRRAASEAPMSPSSFSSIQLAGARPYNAGAGFLLPPVHRGQPLLTTTSLSPGKFSEPFAYSSYNSPYLPKYHSNFDLGNMPFTASKAPYYSRTTPNYSPYRMTPSYSSPPSASNATPQISDLRRRIESRLDTADTSSSHSSGPVDFMTIRQYLRELNDKVTKHKTMVDRYAPVDEEDVNDRYKQIIEKMKSYNAPSSNASAGSSDLHRRLNRLKRRTRYD